MSDDQEKPPADTKTPITLESVFGARDSSGSWDPTTYKALGGASGVEKLLREAPPPPATADESALPPTSPADDRPPRLTVPDNMAGYLAVRERLMAEHEQWLDEHDPRRSSFRGNRK